KDYTGKCETGYNVTQTFFAQHQLESLHLNNEILQELVSFAPKHTETELRSILGCFLFTGDDVFKKIKVLSGGEKSRVALAKALTADANFLILDEPTNHLDMQSVNILIQALQQFEGTLILVSHDRYFLDSIANKIWFIENREIKEYPGTYQEYEPWYAKRKLQQKEEATVVPKPQPVKEEQPAKQPSNDKAKQLKKLNQELAKMEEEIADLEKTIKLLEEQLADDKLYSDASNAARVMEEYQLKKLNLLEVQSKWGNLAEQILELEA
ncbi:MAG TPA: ATP-binding cassette domain-containing protein, partial [Mucilaginibacter sp.]|nr:ATP-binding cassette domain-containing protein [Mucilaginibacter sp.]